MRVLGIDIGGSALKGALVETNTGRLLTERFRIATPTHLTPREMAGAAADIAGHFKWKGPIGAGFPGVIHGTRILTAANLDPGFVDLDGGKLFAKATGCTVAMTNDAAAAALAEMKFGAGRNFPGKALLLTLGLRLFGFARQKECIGVPLCRASFGRQQESQFIGCRLNRLGFFFQGGALAIQLGGCGGVTVA